MTSCVELSERNALRTIALQMTSSSPAHSSPNWPGFFNAFGTILFAFGGASCFPTIQVDMKEPQKFPISVVLGITSE